MWKVGLYRREKSWRCPPMMERGETSGHLRPRVEQEPRQRGQDFHLQANRRMRVATDNRRKHGLAEANVRDWAQQVLKMNRIARERRQRVEHHLWGTGPK